MLNAFVAGVNFLRKEKRSLRMDFVSFQRYHTDSNVCWCGCMVCDLAYATTPVSYWCRIFVCKWAKVWVLRMIMLFVSQVFERVRTKPSHTHTRSRVHRATVTTPRIIQVSTLKTIKRYRGNIWRSTTRTRAHTKHIGRNYEYDERGETTDIVFKFIQSSQYAPICRPFHSMPYTRIIYTN